MIHHCSLASEIQYQMIQFLFLTFKKHFIPDIPPSSKMILLNIILVKFSCWKQQTVLSNGERAAKKKTSENHIESIELL